MKVAVLGLGAMGAPIARRLEAAGFELAVYNRTPGPASAFRARIGVTPAEAAAGADVAVSMLADGPAVETVLSGETGALSADPPPRVIVDMSTIDVATSQRVAVAAAAAGVGYLRAPVSGNPSVVEAGHLTILSSGEPSALDVAKPVLDAIGPTVFHLGTKEEARVMKLALNLMVAGTMQLLAEALALGEGHDLDRGQLLEVIGGSAVGSPFVQYKAAPLVADDYSTTFAARLMRKDVDLVLAAADTPLPLTAVVRRLLQDCVDAGKGDLDFSVLVPMLRESPAVQQT
jgi:3-hydroxyisobutyrate dehydrogenase-like beta-hydroxyacid dehydrogenase